MSTTWAAREHEAAAVHLVSTSRHVGCKGMLSSVSRQPDQHIRFACGASLPCCSPAHSGCQNPHSLLREPASGQGQALSQIHAPCRILGAACADTAATARVPIYTFLTLSAIQQHKSTVWFTLGHRPASYSLRSRQDDGCEPSSHPQFLDYRRLPILLCYPLLETTETHRRGCTTCFSKIVFSFRFHIVKPSRG